MSEWLLFNANSASFQLYYGENKLIFNCDDDNEVHFVQDQHAKLDFYSASSLKQQSAGRHVAPQVRSDRGSNPRSTALEASTLTITPLMRSQMLEKTEEAIKNGQSRDTWNIEQKTQKEDKQNRNKHNTENYKKK